MTPNFLIFFHFHGLPFSSPTHRCESWHMHMLFAFAVVQILRPKRIVELGTHKGDSYCAFCQAVDELGLEAACFAVDSWEGDEQAGFYGPEVLENLAVYHDPLYGRFSRLVKAYFDEALPFFEDRSIDLLHIDGCHTYEAVKKDFRAWLPKVSDRGIVLLHDTNVREREFGVWRLWEEIRSDFSAFRVSLRIWPGRPGSRKTARPVHEGLFEESRENAPALSALFYRLQPGGKGRLRPGKTKRRGPSLNVSPRLRKISRRPWKKRKGILKRPTAG